MPDRRAPESPPAAPTAAGFGSHALACGFVIAVAAVGAYRSTFSVPLLFDDETSIATNATIRHLATAWWPPAGTTVSGRPILNLSFAINYALGGADVWSYHALNLAIHVLAGLTLFGVLRRTFVPPMGEKATGMAFAVALLWTLHPLLTESVTYTVQRAESLMGLFYLVTLYCFIRSAGASGAAKNLWGGAAVAACLLGMGTKEVMVSAPLVVLLYDRTFVAGGYREALRLRKWLYGGLAATWIPLLFLVLETHGRGGSAGFASGVPWWRYALLQFPAIVHYLQLSLVPFPLVFDYGRGFALNLSVILPCMLVVAALLAVTLWALVKSPVAGFLGACFFLLLAPSSSVVPVATEVMAEHRMYLALVPVLVLMVAAIYRWLGRAAVTVCVVVAAALSFATTERNRDYRSEEAIWTDTVKRRPDNERAQDNLGFVLSRIPGRSDDAIAHYEEALRLKPDFVEAHYNLAFALLFKPGRLNDAILHYEEALRLDPSLVEVHFNLARALESVPGRSGEAIAQYEEALRLRPNFAEAHYNLGSMLQAMPGRSDEAIGQFEEAIRLMPGNPGAHFSLGCALQTLPGGLDDAIRQYAEAVRLKPDYVEARCNLGNALASRGRTGEAISEYAKAVRLRPDDATIHLNFAIILLGDPSRAGEAVAQLRDAVRLQPGNEKATRILARLGVQP